MYANKLPSALKDQAALTFNDVLIVPQYSECLSRSDIDLSTKLGPFNLRTPIISSNMSSITEDKMVQKMDQLGGLGIYHRYNTTEFLSKATLKSLLKGPLAHSVGSILSPSETINLESQRRINWCINNADIICVDIAHGHSIHMKKTLEYIRYLDKDIFVIAGNVCTIDGTTDLIRWGASCVKVGIGPGAACSTRGNTGHGYPQLQAVANCSRAGRTLNIPIIADGGCKSPGDIAKCLAVGASAVMIGGMLAGTDCCPGWEEAMDKYHELCQTPGTGLYMTHGFAIPPTPSIKYQGMASLAAKTSAGKQAKHEEGAVFEVQCKPEGSTEQVINHIRESLQSALSYSGCMNLQEFYNNSILELVSSSTVTENSTHFQG